jgi:hypothetical protein
MTISTRGSIKSRNSILAESYDGEFERIFFSRAAESRHCGKWQHYFSIYERHLSRFRGRKTRLLEIGVQNGGSIDVYRQFFGAGLDYIGVDINPACKQLEQHYSAGVHIEIGDSGDRPFINQLGARLDPIDIVIDDGSHLPAHQLQAFESLYQRLSRDGVYLVEDLHTNFFPSYGGGRRSTSTFLAYAKELTDALHDHVYRDPYYWPRLIAPIEKLLFNVGKRLRVLSDVVQLSPWLLNKPEPRRFTSTLT